MKSSALVILLAASALPLGCLSDQRGARVKFDALAAVKVDSPPEERVKAASQALTVNFVDITKVTDGKIALNDDGQDLIIDPVGAPLVVANQSVWWLEDLQPLIAEGSNADKSLDAHLTARGEAMQHDQLYNIGVAYTGTGLAISGVGLLWLLAANGGDPAFYLTLATSAATAAGGTGIFATWFILQEAPSIEARKQKYEVMKNWPEGVAQRYRVKVEPGEAANTLKITADGAPVP